MNLRKTTLATATFLLLTLPDVPLAQEAPAPPPGTGTPQPSWAIDVHGGSYSLDKVLDALYEKHPSMKGPTAGVSFHFWGDEGPDRYFRHVVSLDYARAEGKGTWQVEPKDKEGYGSVDATMVSLTYTALWHLLPTKRVNPYLGVGFGAAYWQVEAAGGGDKASGGATLPVLYFPLGLNVKITDRLWVHAETSLVGLVYKNWTQYYVGGVKVLF
ncbi:MAG: hypothetical protein HYR98_04200 [Nitrospirae bacterium]|nr:hypothetical protein [Nitrospirota bacterium]